MPDRSRSRLPWIIGGVGALAVVAVIGVVWLLSGSEPDAVDLRSDAASDDASDATSDDASDTTDDPASNELDASDDGSDGAVDGVWVVDVDAVAFDPEEGTGSFVGYRVDEELSGIGATTAVGRTPAVDGTVTLEGGAVTGAEVVADLTQLTSDDSRRDGRLRSSLSPTATATFALTEAIATVELLENGEVSDATATGELTIEGVTRPADVVLQVARRDGSVVVAGSTTILLSDFEVDAPSAPIVLSVSDEAVIEWQLYLAPSTS